MNGQSESSQVFQHQPVGGQRKAFSSAEITDRIQMKLSLIGGMKRRDQRDPEGEPKINSFINAPNPGRALDSRGPISEQGQPPRNGPSLIKMGTWSTETARNLDRLGAKKEVNGTPIKADLETIVARKTGTLERSMIKSWQERRHGEQGEPSNENKGSVSRQSTPGQSLSDVNRSTESSSNGHETTIGAMTASSSSNPRPRSFGGVSKAVFSITTFDDSATDYKGMITKQ